MERKIQALTNEIKICLKEIRRLIFDLIAGTNQYIDMEEILADYSPIVDPSATEEEVREYKEHIEKLKRAVVAADFEKEGEKKIFAVIELLEI